MIFNLVAECNVEKPHKYPLILIVAISGNIHEFCKVLLLGTRSSISLPYPTPVLEFFRFVLLIYKIILLSAQPEVVTDETYCRFLFGVG